MTKIPLYTFLILMLACGYATAQNTDQPSNANPNPNLFLDCGRCYRSYLKKNVTFVNYVRDKTDAQIHLLITRAQTGSGGTEYTLSFIGRKGFTGMDKKLVYVSSDTDTQEETRAGLANHIKIGLIPYISQTSLISQIGINFSETSENSTKQKHDKWNYWIFEIGANTSLSGEEQQTSNELEIELDASRITQAWKIELEAQGNYERERFELDDGDTTFTRSSNQFESLYCKEPFASLVSRFIVSYFFFYI